MTSRTIDMHCTACRKYLFSLQPDDYKGIALDYYCKKKACQEQAIIDKIKGV